MRSKIKRHLPWPVLYTYRKIYYFPEDFVAAVRFLFGRLETKTTLRERWCTVKSFYAISYRVDCPHTEHELLSIARMILDLGPGVPGAIVEAGAFHGGSTAKLSLVAALAQRDLLVFDSFEGMPENNEAHGRSIFGREHHFPKGSHAVGLEEVEANVAKYGVISRCRFFPGWFKDTLSPLRGKVAVLCINADLAESTRDCVKYVYPRVSRGGLILSQDGHFPWIIKLLEDENFWKRETGAGKPLMCGLGFSKLVVIAAHSVAG